MADFTADRGDAGHSRPGHAFLEEQDGDGHDDGHEHVAGPIRQALNVRPAVLRPLDSGDDAGHSRGIANGGDFHEGLPVEIDGPRIDASAAPFFHRQRFAGQHRLIHAALAFNQAAVGWNAVSGSQDYVVARLKVRGGHLRFRSVGVASGGGRRGQLEQGAQ